MAKVKFVKSKTRADSLTASNADSDVVGVYFPTDSTDIIVGGKAYGVDTNTDTKVTAVGNHYAPSADSSAALSVDASGGTATTAGATTQVVTGVNIQRDAKGHVTGLTVDSKGIKDTDTHYTTGINAGASGATSNSAQTNPYVTVKDNSTYRGQIQLKGGGITTVTSNANGVVTISSANPNTGKQFQCGTSYSGAWTHLGTWTSAGDSSSVVIEVLTGAGWNGMTYQNTKFTIFIKDGYQSTASTTRAFAATVDIGAENKKMFDIEVSVQATSNTVCEVWVYLNAACSSGNYTVRGLGSWVHSGTNQSDAPTTGTEQSVSYYYIATLDDKVASATNATKLVTARTIQTNLASTSAASFDGTANITPGVTGTLPVSHGGTGATSLTSGSVLIGNGTSAVTLRQILNNTTTGALGWTGTTANGLYLLTANSIAYWNGAYSGTSSNLAYCNKGAFGNIVTKSLETSTDTDVVTENVRIGKVVYDAKSGIPVVDLRNYFGLFTRSQIGTSPNYDNPGFNGAFELRVSSEVTGESGTKPFNGYGAFLSFGRENFMMQIAGNSTASAFYIRSVQKASATLAGISWQRLVTNSGTWSINISGTATKATQDTNGQTIASTYIKGLSVSGKTITYTKGDGTTGTITTQDTTYTSLKNPNALKIKAGSSDVVSYDGSAATTVTLNGVDGITVEASSSNNIGIKHSNSVTAGTAGTSSATSGSTLAVPYVTYDAQGHVTASGTHTHTVTGFLTSHQDISGKSDTTHTHSVKINGTTKTIAATGGTAVDLGTYLTSHANGIGKIKVGDTTLSSTTSNDTLTVAGSNIGAALDTTNKKLTLSLTKANVTAALGYTPPTTNTTYGTATYATSGLVKPWYSHTAASTGPTAGTDSTAVAVNSKSSTAGRYYPIEMDSNGRMFVNVPWVDTNTNTTYLAGTGLTLSGTTFKAKLNSETSLGTIGTTSKLYAVGVDANGKLAVNVPWTDTNTTYTSLPNPNALNFQIDGTSSGNYNGEAAATINLKAGSNVSLSSSLDSSTNTRTVTINSSYSTTATKLGTSTVGGAAKPIYLNEGTATACSSTVGSATKPVYMSSGTITAGSTYAGGTAVTLNGSSKAASTASFYAPTSAGTSGYYLKSNGSGAPSWASLDVGEKVKGQYINANISSGGSVTINASNETSYFRATVSYTISGFSNTLEYGHAYKVILFNYTTSTNTVKIAKALGLSGTVNSYYNGSATSSDISISLSAYAIAQLEIVVIQDSGLNATGVFIRKL